MIGVIKGTMRQKKEVNGLPLPIASYKANMKAPIRSLKVAINATQSGSGTPAPDNIRPIIGASECNVVRCGVNVWDEEIIVASSRIQSKNYISVKPSTQYRRVTPENIYVIYFDKEKNEIGHANWGKTAFTTPDNCYYVKIMVDPAYGTTYNNDISINYPATDTDYHAYNGNTYTIQLGDTYYGGSLDVTTGVLTVTHGFKDLGTLTWANNVTGIFSTQITDLSKANKQKVKSSWYGYGVTQFNWSDVPTYADKTINTATNNYIYIKDTDYSDAPSFKTAVNGVQLVYELATPITVQLTPTQIEQLLGANNVWADTGDVEELIYTDRQVYYGR